MQCQEKQQRRADVGKRNECSRGLSHGCQVGGHSSRHGGHGLATWCPSHGGFRQPLYGVFMRLDVHNGNTRDLSDAPPQVAITCGHQVAPVLLHPLTNTVICVGALVGAWQPFYSWVFGYFEGHSVLLSQFLELSHDAVGDAWGAFRIQAVHHALHQVDLIADGEVDEVCIDNDLVGGP